jgi:hypothetical protein
MLTLSSTLGEALSRHIKIRLVNSDVVVAQVQRVFSLSNGIVAQVIDEVKVSRGISRHKRQRDPAAEAVQRHLRGAHCDRVARAAEWSELLSLDK